MEDNLKQLGWSQELIDAFKAVSIVETFQRLDAPKVDTVETLYPCDSQSLEIISFAKDTNTLSCKTG
ncbi:MAG: hypothetical protein AB7F43_07805 [Bacteriovoracia bacterium]